MWQTLQWDRTKENVCRCQIVQHKVSLSNRWINGWVYGSMETFLLPGKWKIDTSLYKMSCCFPWEYTCIDSRMIRIYSFPQGKGSIPFQCALVLYFCIILETAGFMGPAIILKDICGFVCVCESPNKCGELKVLGSITWNYQVLPFRASPFCDEKNEKKTKYCYQVISLLECFFAFYFKSAKQIFLPCSCNDAVHICVPYLDVILQTNMWSNVLLFCFTLLSTAKRPIPSENIRVTGCRAVEGKLGSVVQCTSGGG